MNAFSASYSDFKLVKTRGCVQIIFEVPVEQSTAVLKILGGMPTPAEEKWFGIAPLDPKLIGPEASGGAVHEAGSIPVRSTKSKQAWNDMAPSQQAGLLCSDQAFWKFLRGYGLDIHDAESAAVYVRNYCNVKSRSEIVPGKKSSHYWGVIVEQYRLWQREPEYVA